MTRIRIRSKRKTWIRVSPPRKPRSIFGSGSDLSKRIYIFFIFFYKISFKRDIGSACDQPKPDPGPTKAHGSGSGTLAETLVLIYLRGTRTECLISFSPSGVMKTRQVESSLHSGHAIMSPSRSAGACGRYLAEGGV